MEWFSITNCFFDAEKLHKKWNIFRRGYDWRNASIYLVLSYTGHALSIVCIHFVCTFLWLSLSLSSLYSVCIYLILFFHVDRKFRAHENTQKLIELSTHHYRCSCKLYIYLFSSMWFSHHFRLHRMRWLSCFDLFRESINSYETKMRHRVKGKKKQKKNLLIHLFATETIMRWWDGTECVTKLSKLKMYWIEMREAENIEIKQSKLITEINFRSSAFSVARLTCILYAYNRIH